MEHRIGQPAPGHSPRAWDNDEDPNAPWLPRIPGPRKPSAVTR